MFGRCFSRCFLVFSWEGVISAVGEQFKGVSACMRVGLGVGRGRVCDGQLGT